MIIPIIVAVVLAAIGYSFCCSGNRALLLIAFYAVVALTFVGLGDMLGRPRPMTFSTINAEATVLRSVLKENDAIYLYLAVPGIAEPRSVVLPWNKNLAKQLMQAQGAAQRGSGKVKMHMRGIGSGDDRKPMFYPDPQPPLPLKQNDGGPVHFEG